eukprot:TRINITY_DN570_c0_g2_i2.p1 TRINITY_DN570_c0_g2~~TRINITY_DN570_c0_g2_i2.p1  ORF type:complete len:361 (+),score=95.21 TRINITY_DN570_c0_g2_i2:50-1084(+)
MSNKRKRKDEVSSSSSSEEDSDSSSGGRYPKRKRRRLEKRFSFSNFERPPWEVPEGPGKKLSDIMVVKKHIENTSRSHPFMRALHFTLFSRAGKKMDLKKNILAFSGISALKQDEEWQEFCQSKLMTKTKKYLFDMHSFFCLKGDSKDARKDLKKRELCGDIAEFLYKPSRKLVNTDEPAWVSVEEREKRERRRKRKANRKKKMEESSESDSSDEDKKKKKKRKKKKKSKKNKKAKSKWAGDVGTGDYVTEYAVTGRATCHYINCKKNIAAEEVRLGKVGTLGKDGDLTVQWYHPKCMFKYLKKRARPSTRKITSEDDIHGLSELSSKDQKALKKMIPAAEESD